MGTGTVVGTGVNVGRGSDGVAENAFWRYSLEMIREEKSVMGLEFSRISNLCSAMQEGAGAA